MDFLTGFLLSNSVIIGGEKATEAAQGVSEAVTEATTAVTQANAGGIGGLGSMGGMILYIAGLVALFYFFAIRPQKKKEKELTAMQNSVNVGDWVMTSSGFYGKVVDIADQVFVVEFGTNKGVRIPVRKSEIMGNKEPNLTNKSIDEE